MATVLQPLDKIYHTPMTLAPLSVVLDARRALAALGGKKNKRSFHRDVGYVYRKQLEEAEWLVVNKTDLMEEEDLLDLRARLDREFPGKRQFYVSAKTGEGLEEWMEALLTNESGPSSIMEVDYERYADGEALLGWVNLEGTAEVPENDPGDWLRSLGETIAISLDQNGYEVGHFKMSLEGHGKRWRVHQVMGGEEIELVAEVGEVEGEACYAGQRPALHMLVNLRAEGDALALQGLVHQALAAHREARVTLTQEAAFQPGKPVPTHRVQ